MRNPLPFKLFLLQVKCNFSFADFKISLISRFSLVFSFQNSYPQPPLCCCCCCSVTMLCLTLCDPMDCSTPDFLFLHYIPKFAQIHVHWVADAIQPSHPLSSSFSLPSPSVFNLSKLQGLFQWVGSSHQMAKELELQLQHQSFQWIFRVDFL